MVDGMNDFCPKFVLARGTLERLPEGRGWNELWSGREGSCMM